ncbi:MAG TPA: hypothetical protein DHW82_08055 [Spirochaetia bacterium]|nr:hypothetical protein [Spirochaetia bacterium]
MNCDKKVGKMPFAENNGTKIFYEVSGEGEPLVLLMGLGGTHEAWNYHLPFYNARFKVITVDNRGAGQSDKPDVPYTMDDFADDLNAVFIAAGIEQAFVLGLSMGGLIAQEFYHRYPSKVKGLILGCTGVGAGDPFYIYPDKKVMDTLVMERNPDKEFEIADKMTEIFYHEDYRNKIPHLTEKIIENQKKLPKQPPHAYMRQLEACVVKKYNSSRLKDIKVPVLVIHGEDDLVWPLKNALYLHNHIKNSELVVIPKSGHMFFIEKFNEFNQPVLDFLERNKAKKLK